MFRSKLFCALLVGASIVAAAPARADLVLDDRDWASEAFAMAESSGFWEQSDRIEQLVRDGKSAEARELLASMQARLKVLQQRVDTLASRSATGTVRSATW